MTRVIACPRCICVGCADILVSDTQSNTRSVSLLALENIVLYILHIDPRRAHATAFVDLFIEFIDQVHGFRTFGPELEIHTVRTCRAEIRIVVNQVFSMSQGTAPVVSRETLGIILLAISDRDIRNELFDS